MTFSVWKFRDSVIYFWLKKQVIDDRWSVSLIRDVSNLLLYANLKDKKKKEEKKTPLVTSICISFSMTETKNRHISFCSGVLLFLLPYGSFSFFQLLCLEPLLLWWKLGLCHSSASIFPSLLLAFDFVYVIFCHKDLKIIVRFIYFLCFALVSYLKSFY